MTGAPDGHSLNLRVGEDRTPLTVSDDGATGMAAGHSSRDLPGGGVDLVERRLTSPHPIDEGERLVATPPDLGLVYSKPVAVLHQLHLGQGLIVGRNQIGRPVGRYPVLDVDLHAPGEPICRPGPMSMQPCANRDGAANQCRSRLREGAPTTPSACPTARLAEPAQAH